MPAWRNTKPLRMAAASKAITSSSGIEGVVNHRPIGPGAIEGREVGIGSDSDPFRACREHRHDAEAVVEGEHAGERVAGAEIGDPGQAPAHPVPVDL